MQARVFVILFITCIAFSNFVSGQFNILGTTQSHLDAKALRESYNKPTKPSTPAYTPPKNNSNNPSSSSAVPNKTESLPSAEAQKAYDDAGKNFDEKIKLATACVCKATAYTEVKFIHNANIYQIEKFRIKTKSQELFDKARQMNDVQLLSGYLLTIKNGSEFVVVVENYQNGKKYWSPYTIKWDKNNWGKYWSDRSFNYEVSGLSSNASLTDKLKYLEKAILNEGDRRTAEAKSNYEAGQKKAEDDEIERISQAWNIKQLEPYKVMYVGNLEGFKLDIKNYYLGPDEAFVAFFVSKEGKAASQTIYDGYVYKVVFYKNHGDIFSAVPFMNYSGIIPSELLNELANDPIKYKIIERMVNLKLGLIGTYESEKQEQAEKKYFQEKYKRLEDKNQKQANEGKKFISHMTYTGDTYKGVYYGIGIKTEANRVFHGLFINDSPAYGLESGPDGVKQVYYEHKLTNNPLKFYINSNGNITIQDTYGYGTQIFKNGDIYYGKQLSKGQARGTRLYNNGDIYNGEFTDSLFEGLGFYYNSNGGMYEGSYKKGLENGGGTQINADGSAKSTIFENGVRKKKSNNDTWKNRYGEIKYPSGDRFIGHFPEGREKSKSYGKLFLSNGDVCYGDFLFGFRGIILKKDGRKIYGRFNFSDDQNTKVKISPSKDSSVLYNIIYPGSEMYFGNISDSSTKAGKGIYCYSNGDIYIGEFNNDLRQANEGLLIYKNGDVFNGSFINDKIEGPGEYLDAAKKEKYQGNFKNGVRDGEGTVYFADGTSKTVKYINGVLQ